MIAIPNGINIPNPSPNPHPRPHPYHLHIGCISRLTKDKGVDLLIDAAKDIKGINLTIVGSGRDEDSIKKLICQSANLPIAVKSRIDDLTSFYNSLDLLVLPSREHDPFGLVVAEAMMLGIPCVVTDACGIADYLVDGKDGIIVRADSVKDLNEGIHRVIDNADLRYSIANAGQKKAQKEFTVDKMVSRYSKLIKPNRQGA